MFKFSDFPSATLSALALALGCSGAPDLAEPEVDLAEPVDQQSEAIRDGTETERAGVVRIRLCKNADCSRTSYCTGVAIAPTVLLTAGHCVDDLPDPDGDLDHVRVQVRYRRNGAYVCVSGSTSNGECADWHDAIFSHVYQGNHDAASDIAKISLVYGHADVTPLALEEHELAYVYVDSMSHYSRLQGFGYGQDGNGASGRLMTGTFEVDWYGSAHFITINRGSGTCAGDSGGPAMIYRDKSGEEPQVVGLLSNHESRYFWKEDTCAYSGKRSRWVRLSAHMNWIETTGPNSLGCQEITSPSNGRRLLKCF